MGGRGFPVECRRRVLELRLGSPSSLWSRAVPGLEEAAVLVELGVAAQRYQAVLGVLQAGPR